MVLLERGTAVKSLVKRSVAAAGAVSAGVGTIAVLAGSGPAVTASVALPERAAAIPAIVDPQAAGVVTPVSATDVYNAVVAGVGSAAGVAGSYYAYKAYQATQALAPAAAAAAVGK
jgi:hypothetical protein